MASVASEGPFSRFPGIDRQLLVLRGEGLALSIAGAAEHVLDGGSAPLAFAGELDVSSRLLGGPVTDFNAMTRRGVYTQALWRIELLPGEQVYGERFLTLLLPLQADLPYTSACGGGQLAPLDALLLEPGEHACSAAAAPSACVLLTLERAVPSE